MKEVSNNQAPFSTTTCYIPGGGGSGTHVAVTPGLAQREGRERKKERIPIVIMR